jgi:hypothetical protein
MPYRLSRKFFTTQHDETIPDPNINLKSTIALLLGILPFGSTKLWLLILNFAASLNIGSLGCLAGFLTMFSAKTFSYSQWLIWGKYVPSPSGDSLNSRLAQYGWDDQPWIDLRNIIHSFYYPEDILDEDWNLGDWVDMEI